MIFQKVIYKKVNVVKLSRIFVVSAWFHFKNYQKFLWPYFFLCFQDQVVGWKLRCSRRFPWRILSRHLGTLLHTKLKPHFLNTIVIYCYAWLFDCKIDEADCENISQYECLGDFFVRKLKPGCRTVDQSTAVVSPADGIATFNGSFEGGFLEQVINLY